MEERRQKGKGKGDKGKGDKDKGQGKGDYHARLQHGTIWQNGAAHAGRARSGAECMHASGPVWTR